MMVRSPTSAKPFCDLFNLTTAFPVKQQLDESALIDNVTSGRTGLVVRASGSGSGDPGSILGRVGVLFP